MSTATTGFFPAPGTNYSVGDEPTIAQRLNALANGEGLHLIGLSGYRTPKHSLEVGGFANDPHTRGAASDTPGIQGVSEATLEQYGLTRPLPGAAEADHIQLLPGWRGSSGGGGGILGTLANVIDSLNPFGYVLGNGQPAQDAVRADSGALGAGRTAVDTVRSIGDGISWVGSNWQRVLLSGVLVLGAIALLLYGTWLFFRTTDQGSPDGD